MSKCADMNCGYYWQDEDEDYPRCHCGDGDIAPCECEDEPIEYEEEEVEDGEGFFICPVCGVLYDGVSVCYNCGYNPDDGAPGDYNPDWRHPSDKPYKEDDE